VDDALLMQNKSDSQTQAAAHAPVTGAPRRWVRRLALIPLGLVLGLGACQLWSNSREQQRLHQARQQAETLFAMVAPKVEARLGQAARQAEVLLRDLDRVVHASRAASIELPRYRVQQKRLEMAAAEVEAGLGRLAAFAEQARQSHRPTTTPDLLTPERRAKLADLTAQRDELRQALALIGPELDLARERRTQLLVRESEQNRRAEAAATALMRAQEEARLRAEAAAAQQAQSEARRRAQEEVLRQAQAEAARLAALETIPAPLKSVAPEIRYVRVLPARPSHSLVIGSSYPDRFLGYRNFHRYGPLPFVVPCPPPPPWCW
jgi:hypothetical protein